MESEDTLNLQCPQCSTRLRMLPAMLEKSWFRCPECSAALVVANLNGKFAARLVSSLAATSDPMPMKSSTKSMAQWSADPELRRRLVAASVVAVIASLAVFSLFSIDRKPEQLAADNRNVDATPSPSGIKPGEPDLVDQSAQVETRRGSLESIDTTSASLDSGPDPVEPDADSSNDSLAIPPLNETIPEIPVPRLTVVDEPAPKPSTELPPARPLAEKPAERLATTIERLNVPIASFEQGTPASGAEVIDIVEQMTGIKVHASEVSSDLATRKITLRLRETSPLEILRAACEQLGLKVHVEGDLVRLSQPSPK